GEPGPLLGSRRAVRDQPSGLVEAGERRRQVAVELEAARGRPDVAAHEEVAALVVVRDLPEPAERTLVVAYRVDVPATLRRPLRPCAEPRRPGPPRHPSPATLLRHGGFQARRPRDRTPQPLAPSRRACAGLHRTVAPRGVLPSIRQQ